MTMRRSGVVTVVPDVLVTETLAVDTRGQGFTDITTPVRTFLRDTQICMGTLSLFLRHTSASLLIQENADPDVQADLLTALARLAPEDGGWIHDAEGQDDMPAHIKAMLAGVSLQVPVVDGALGLGTWQGIYLLEHRVRPHRRDIIMQCLGCR